HHIGAAPPHQHPAIDQVEQVRQPVRDPDGGRKRDDFAPQLGAPEGRRVIGYAPPRPLQPGDRSEEGDRASAAKSDHQTSGARLPKQDERYAESSENRTLNELHTSRESEQPQSAKELEQRVEGD